MYSQDHQPPSGSHQQTTGHSSQHNYSGENPGPTEAEAAPTYQCWYCTEEATSPQETTSPLVYCFGCEETICVYHWHEERKHDSNFPKASLHTQVDLGIYMWAQSTLNAKVDLAGQQRLHREDLRSLWFGLDIGTGSTPARFINTDVYRDLIKSSMFPDKAQQFPSLVSFVGPTGAGKSTLIKGLINLVSQGQRFPTPVSGSDKGAEAPTSSDVHLYADPSSLNNGNPILLVDCEGLGAGYLAPSAMDPYNGLGLAEVLQETSMTVNIRDFNSEETRPTRKFCLEDLYPRIIYAFSDVICFVTNSSKSSEGTVERLIAWADQVLTKTINQPSLPRAIIVANGMQNDPDGWLDIGIATEAMLGRVKKVPLVDPEMFRIAQSWRNGLSNGRQLNSLFDLLQLYFQNICVVYIPSKQGSKPDIIYKQYEKLRCRIEDEVQRVQTEKERSENRLNTTELAQLFKAAFDHFSHNSNKPFDFFEFSRNINPLPEAFEDHALGLMQKMHRFHNNFDDAEQRISIILASCISLATLEAETFRFPTERILQDYQQLCKSAYKRYYASLPCLYIKDGKRCVNRLNGHEKGHQDQSGAILDQGDYVAAYNPAKLQTFWNNISASYTERTTTLRHLKAYPDQYISQVLLRHRRALSSEEDFWKSTISHLTCFVCLSHHPDNVLPCRHAICESCIKQFGVRNIYDASVFTLEQCPLCQKTLLFKDAPFVIQLKPENAGVRILCLDGGGIRTVISSKILELLESETGLEIPIHEFFDLIVGTGTGGVVALSLGRNRWFAQECVERFKKFTKHAFKSQTFFDILWSQYYYRAQDLEAQLQKAFQDGVEKRLLFGDDFTGPFAGDATRSRALKVAVTATTPVDAKAYLMTNYNQAKMDDHFEVMNPKLYRMDDPKYDMEVWEAARCTSAAPPMFLPYEAKNGQNFENDGLKYINPAKIGNKEATLLWPNSSQLDYLVTLGTGCYNKPPEDTSIVGNMRRSLFGSFSYYFNTETIWEQYKSTLDLAQLDRHHRFNLLLSPRNFVGRDQTSSINQLEIDTSEAFNRGKPDRRRLTQTANSLIAALFYARIESISQSAEHTYSVRAILVCRLEQRYHAKVVTALFGRNAYFQVGDRKTEITVALLDFVRNCGFCSLPIEFVVADLKDKTEVYLVLDAEKPLGEVGYHVSGSPFTLEKVSCAADVEERCG